MITELWAWVSTDPRDGQTNILAYSAGKMAAPLPLIATDAEELQLIAELGREMHAAKPKAPAMQLLHFTRAQILEELDHEQV